MVSIERILCPIDFSKYSGRALHHAVAMGQWYKAKVTALHVFSIPPLVDVVPSLGVGGIQPILLTDAEREALLERMHAFVPKLDGPEQPPVELLLQETPDVRAEILAQAEQSGADLIVVGSHGRSGFEHMLLGSTTERILRKAGCPVLVVPRHAEDDAAPHPVMPFVRIVCPVDFSDASLQALTYALQLAEEADATLLVLHVIQMPPQLDEMRDVLAREVDDIRAEAEARAVRRLGQLVPESARAYCTINTTVVEGSAHREIIRAAAEHQADLIVMGVHGRGAVDLTLFGSTTHAVLRHATCPVLTVHHG